MILRFGYHGREIGTFLRSEACCANPFAENLSVYGAKVQGLPSWVDT
jgi:hypothetical protein